MAAFDQSARLRNSITQNRLRELARKRRAPNTKQPATARGTAELLTEAGNCVASSRN